MVQFTIAYVALGFAVLLMLGGVLALTQRPARGTLSPLQRLVLYGGLGGMVAFMFAVALWLRR
jgi:hypothetical protein